jgi:hypothetical protein
VTEVTSELRVTMRHVRAAKLCSRGARAWFKHYELDYNDFLTNGILAAKLEATGDPLALRAVAAAKEEAGTDG